ncbi:MAG: hypothetical protein UZ12_BCD005003062 [Bacteroidetes bacterium OLB12]|nr:MAG: hypothetical protein UZ12_BCD005003062 [Bacteroidetes bacterium OLB12]
MTTKDKETGKDSYTIKTSKTKKGELRTEIIYAPYKVIQDSQIIATGTTSSDGEFRIENLRKGTYEIQIDINRFLRADTLIELNEKRTRIEIELDDKHLWRYLDSTQLAKFPYNKEIAERDIQNGEVKILSAGLQLLSDNDLDSVTIKYGFKYFPVAGCIVDSYQDKAMEDYNSVVYEYLDKLNGQHWRENLKADIKTLYLSLGKKNER